MKKLIFISLVFELSCQPQKLEVQQIISDEPVSIFPYYKASIYWTP